MTNSSNEQVQTLTNETQIAKNVVDDKLYAYMQSLRDGVAGPWSDSAANSLEIARQDLDAAQKRLEDFMKTMFS